MYDEQFIYTLSPIIVAYDVLMGLKVFRQHLIHIHHGTVLCLDSCPAILLSVS